MATIAVTGASGFVARHLIPVLLEAGHEVRGLARSAPDGTGSRGTAAHFTFRPGDVRRPRDVSTMLAGCEYVIHLAASFDPVDDQTAISVEGTRNVLDAAREAGVERLVYLSCLGAQASAHSPFYAAKWQAESLIRGSGMPYTILLPSLVVGNGDGVLGPLAWLVRQLPVVPLPVAGSDRMQPIDVADLCRCITASLTDDTLKDEMVSIGGPVFLTFSELVDLVSGVVGVQKRKVRLPANAIPTLNRLLPAHVRGLLAPARLAQFRVGVVASPGIVPRTFNFEPGNVTIGLESYLA